MFLVKKGQTNTISVSVSLDATIPNPYYLFSFVNILSKDTINFVPKNITNGTEERYDEFEFVEGSPTNLSLDPPQVSFTYEGQYWVYIYEQTGSTNTHISGTTSMLYDGRAQVVEDCVATEQYYEYISDNEDNHNFIFLASDEICGITPTPSITPSITPSPTPSITPSVTPTMTTTPTMTSSPTPSVTASVTPSITPSITPSVTPSHTPTNTPSVTPTLTPTTTSSPTPTLTPTPTSSPFMFDVGFGFGGSSVQAVMNDGDDMYFGGLFDYFNAYVQESIIKTDLVGNIDTSFNPLVPDSTAVFSIINYDANNLIIGGTFTTLNGLSCGRIGKISKSTGTLDPAWQNSNAQSTIQGILKDGTDLIIVGAFTSYNGTARGRIARLNGNNVLDTTIFTGAGFNATPYGALKNLAGNYVVWGTFTTYNGVTTNRIVEINPTTGAKTALFGTGANSNISQVFQDSLGNYYFIGNQSTLNGVAFQKYGKTDSSGNILWSINTGPGVSPGGGFLDETNGYLYVSPPNGGWFRLNTTTGARDAAWDTQQALIIAPGGGTFNITTTYDSQGKLYLPGTCNYFRNQPFNRLVVLDSSGNLKSYV